MERHPKARVSLQIPSQSKQGNGDYFIENKSIPTSQEQFSNPEALAFPQCGPLGASSCPSLGAVVGVLGSSCPDLVGSPGHNPLLLMCARPSWSVVVVLLKVLLTERI